MLVLRLIRDLVIEDAAVGPKFVSGAVQDDERVGQFVEALRKFSDAGAGLIEDPLAACCVSIILPPPTL